MRGDTLTRVMEDGGCANPHRWCSRFFDATGVRLDRLPRAPQRAPTGGC